MIIQSIIKWFDAAKPNPTSSDVAVQIGCHYEEVSEMARALGDVGASTCTSLKGETYKKGCTPIITDHVALLDALCDQIVTAVGVGTLLGYDMQGALEEVNKSNYSKFTTDKDGNAVPVFSDNGKIAKNPTTYRAPDLAPYVKNLRGHRDE